MRSNASRATRRRSLNCDPSTPISSPLLAAWTIDYRPSSDLPPLSWVARVSQPVVVVACGQSVRRATGAFFEGTWVGQPGVESVLESTTPFGSGMVVRDGDLFVVPPGHTNEGVYTCQPDAGTGTLFVGNSLSAVLEATGLELRRDVDYVSQFIRVADGLSATPIEIPTSGAPINYHYYENLRVDADGRLAVVPKPREKPFVSYDDYLARLGAAATCAFANAAGYEPVIALSNGYDSTAMAVVAARAGLRHALTFAVARPARLDEADTADSGASTAERLGLQAKVVDRVSFTTRDDLPEAEFLATVGTGEDVATSAMEPDLHHRLLVTGDVGAALYRYGRPKRSDLYRIDLSGSSYTEFRARLDLVYVPLPVFGMTQIPSLQDITLSDDMKPWSVPGYYNRPIARRIGEEAGGLPRGSFATVKHASTALIHQDPEGGMAPASVRAVREFAAAEGTPLKLVKRPPLRRRERFVIKASHRFHVDRIGRGLAARQWAMIHHEPRQGSLLLRWGVSVVRPRYAAVRRLLE